MEGNVNFLKTEAALDNPKRLSAVQRLTESALPINQIQAVLKELATKIDVRLTAATYLDNNTLYFIATSEGAADGIPRETSHCQYVIGTGRYLCITDVNSDPMWKRLARAMVNNKPLNAYLGFPLKYQGETVGAVCAVDERTRNWTTDDQYEVLHASKAVAKLLEEST